MKIKKKVDKKVITLNDILKMNKKQKINIRRTAL